MHLFSISSISIFYFLVTFYIVLIRRFWNLGGIVKQLRKGLRNVKVKKNKKVNPAQLAIGHQEKSHYQIGYSIQGRTQKQEVKIPCYRTKKGKEGEKHLLCGFISRIWKESPNKFRFRHI